MATDPPEKGRSQNAPVLVTINHGYRYLGDRWLSTCGSADTENIGDLGKLKEVLTLKRGILTEIPDIV